MAPQRVDAAPFDTDVAAQQLQVGDGSHVVVAGGVLGDPHGVVDGGALGGADEARELDHLLSRYAGDEGHLVWRIGRGEHLRLQCLEPFYSCGDIGLVVPLVLYDLLHKAVEQHHVGAGAVGQIEAGVVRHLDPLRIGHDQPRLAHGDGPLDMGANDGVGCRGVGADDEDEIRVVDARDVVGHGAAAERRLQPGDGGGVAEPRAVIHVVGAQLPAHELLEQVVLFVGGFGRRETRQRIAAIALAQGGEAFCNQLNGILPAGGHQLAILADEWGGEALLALDKVKAEASLDAEQPLIDRRVAIPLHIADAVARLIDVEGNAAAHSAVGADGIDRREQLGAPLRLVAGIHQGAGGADLYAGAALHAVGVAHCQPAVELWAVREGAIAVLGKAQHTLHRLFATGLHALAAADAAVGIEHDKFAAVIHCKLLALAGIESALLDLVFGGVVAQCTIGVGLTAALEAAAGFAAGIGITQPALHLGKAALAILLCQMGHDGAGDFFQVSKLGGIDLLEFGGLAGVERTNRIDHVTVEELIDGQCGLATIGDRLDGGGWPAAQIADGEQVAVAAVHGFGMGLQRLPAGEGEGEGLPFHKAEIRLL